MYTAYAWKPAQNTPLMRKQVHRLCVEISQDSQRNVEAGGGRLQSCLLDFGGVIGGKAVTIYVAVSRGAYDAQIFTNEREKLGAAQGHDVSHSSAYAPEMKLEQKQEQQVVTPQREIAQKQEQSFDFGLGL
jgi:hypothetical protein